VRPAGRPVLRVSFSPIRLPRANGQMAVRAVPVRPRRWVTRTGHSVTRSLRHDGLAPKMGTC
jgi:hypothetical protein